MANIRNLDAETGANYIGDDAQPSLTFTNSSTGPGLQVDRIVATSSATIAKLDIAPAILAANATLPAVTVPGSSVASGAVLAFKFDALVSCTTIKFITGGVNGTKAIRIVNPDGTFAWIPVLPDAAVTGAAI